MTKIALFRRKVPEVLTKDVNDFIKDKKVIDIKHQADVINLSYHDNGIPKSRVFYDTVLVVYEEDE